MAKDVVCGMEVNPATAAAKAEYGGKTYHFCAEACRQRFLAGPDRYLQQAAR